jgi:fumarate reductase subunit D
MSRHRMPDDAMSSSPMKFRVEPFLWLAFSGGGVMAAIFLPVLVFLFALAFPLGWIDPPDHAHLAAVVGHPITFLVLLGIFVMILVHAAHRFRYTLYDGLQIKHRVLVAVVCYGGAFFGTFVALHMLGSAT